jgi:hypothetical protein
VPLSFAAVEVFAAAFILGFGQLLLLGSVDENLFELRMLLEQLFESADLLPTLFLATTTTTTAAASCCC